LRLAATVSMNICTFSKHWLWPGVFQIPPQTTNAKMLPASIIKNLLNLKAIVYEFPESKNELDKC
jgi:hypothetical protein